MESTQSKKSSYQLETLELAYKMAKKGAKKGLCDAKSSFFIDGAPEPTRTVDPQLRRLLLYPTELQAQRFNNIIFFLFRNKA